MALSSHFLDEDKALACVHCGLCLGSCPTYLETGMKMTLCVAGSISCVPLKTDASHSMVLILRSPMDRCLGCRACETAYPSGVAYGQLLEATRDHSLSVMPGAPGIKGCRAAGFIGKIFPFPTSFRWAALPAMAVKRMDIASLLPRFLSEAMELLPDKLSRVRLPALAPSHTQPGTRPRGFADWLCHAGAFCKTHQSTIQLIQALGL